MSTWQATVRAPRECVVLMSGEEPAVPTEDAKTSKLRKIFGDDFRTIAQKNTRLKNV